MGGPKGRFGLLGKKDPWYSVFRSETQERPSGKMLLGCLFCLGLNPEGNPGIGWALVTGW